MKHINYIVCHYLNGKLIGRWDYGQDFAYAKDQAEFIANSVYQNGRHQIIAFDEFHPLSSKIYSEGFTL